MTEPIIINGVDVSGCKDFIENICNASNLCGKNYMPCKGLNNCDYKQLKRAMQAIKELQQSLDEKHKFLLALNINTSFEFKRAQLWLAEGKRILEQNRDLQYELNEYKELVKEIKRVIEDKDECLDITIHKISETINEVESER